MRVQLSIFAGAVLGLGAALVTRLVRQRLMTNVVWRPYLPMGSAPLPDDVPLIHPRMFVPVVTYLLLGWVVILAWRIILMPAVRRTLVDRVGRLFPMLNWEVHVLQSGLHKFALRRPWTGVPIAAAALLALWTMYWLVVPVLATLCLLARAVRPLELRLRRAQ